MNEIILASTSKYRKALLERLMVPFECKAPNVDEDQYKKTIKDPYELANVLAIKKAQAVAMLNPNKIVIGSDQLAHLDGLFLSKPKTFEKACEQLKTLSGKTHELVTAVTLIKGDQEYSFTNITKLTMRSLSEKQIETYVNKDMPLDCAGAYKLELHGIALFKKIDSSDHTAIIGLPLIETANHLLKFGVEIP